MRGGWVIAFLKTRDHLNFAVEYQRPVEHKGPKPQNGMVKYRSFLARSNTRPD
jgi:hypothetical protein